MTEILYRIASNSERFNAWAKKKKKNLEGHSLNMFNDGYIESANAGYYTRATFVCFWEIEANESLAKTAPAITQASLMHLAQRLIERDRLEEAELAHHMVINFVRLLSTLDVKSNEEE
jgi:hypothetical protein